LKIGGRKSIKVATGKGILDESAIVWVSQDQVKEVSADVPTPAYYDGDFFVLNDLRKHLSRVEPRTGKVRWTIRTPGSAKYANVIRKIPHLLQHFFSLLFLTFPFFCVIFYPCPVR